MDDRMQNTPDNSPGMPENRPEQDVNYNSSSEVTNPIPSTATPPIPSEMPTR